MSRVVLLLRGVNVGGVTVRSADLREVLEGAGLTNARTVLASGNAIVDADDPAAAARTAEAALDVRYDRRIRVLGLTVEALAATIDAYPFGEDEEHTPYVVFALDAGVLDRLAEAETPEQIALVGDVLCWSNPKGTTLDSPFGKALAKVGGDGTTTRNLRTLRRILTAG